MKHLLVRALALLGLAGIFTSTERVTGAPARDAAPLLWRIEGRTNSWLFGTIHLNDPLVARLAPPVADALAKSDAVFCEVKMDPVTMVSAAMRMFSDGETLSQTLPADLQKAVNAELQRISPALSLAAFDTMRVWALAMTISVLEDQMKHAGGKPLDLLIYEAAVEQRKEAGGLETIDEQLGAMEKFTQAEQIAMLRSTLDGLVEARKQGRSPMKELRDAYLTGDLAVIHKTMNEWMATTKDKKLEKRFLDNLLHERNRLMRDRVLAKLKAAPGKAHFFAVGAAHLYGEDGLVAELKKAGYKVTQVGATTQKP
jgi:uncharacterized protein YbaP (TraB family)